MAPKPPISEATAPPDNIKKMLDETAPETKPVDVGPAYRMLGSERVPVGKATGKKWRGCIDSAKTFRKRFEEAWTEAIKYFNHDQLSHRQSKDGQSGNTYYARRRNENWSETENLVFANVKAVTPAIYAKNPKLEITMPSGQNEHIGRIIERLVDVVAGQSYAPGVKLKTKMTQAVVHAQLTNLAWIETYWTPREMSSEQAVQDLAQLGKDLAEAKTPSEIRTAEGKLMALEEKIDGLNPAGPGVRFHPSTRVYADPDAASPDFSDANWLAIEEMYPTPYLNAMYGEKPDPDGRVKSVYQPTHVLMGDAKTSSDAEDLNNFKMFDTQSDGTTYGYKTGEAYKAAQRTKCWRIFDKVARRIYLFADNDWDWPIWVWNDPYMHPNFWMLRPLSFHTPAMGAMTKGEVTYYLDQQDAVNEIVDEERRARFQVKNKVFYDKQRIDREDVDQFLKGPDKQAMGVNVPEGGTLKDVIFTLAPPSLEFPMLFNADGKRAAIDRISGTGIILRNEEFKTNTTNQAIQKYESTTQTRLDEKLDAIEDCMGEVYFDLAFVCLRFMPKEMVVNLIGPELGDQWVNMQADEIRKLSMRCVGGSTQKPTSTAKKKEAAAVVQALGQFAGADAGGVVLEIALRLLSNAFDEIEMRPEDWDRLRQMAAQASAGSAGPSGEAASTGGPPQAGAPPPAADALQKVAGLIDGLPPQAKEALGKILARGMPVMQAVPALMKELTATAASPEAGVIPHG